MLFLVVFPIASDRLHVMYQNLNQLRQDVIIGPHIHDIEKLEIHQHALINYMYFIERLT
jgi:hypothetical protein